MPTRTNKYHRGMPPGRNYLESQLRIVTTDAWPGQSTWVKDEIFEPQGYGVPTITSSSLELIDEGKVVLTCPEPRLSENYFIEQSLPIGFNSPLIMACSGFATWSNGAAGIAIDEAVSSWFFNPEESTNEFMVCYTQTGTWVEDGVAQIELTWRYYPVIADLVDAEF